MEVDARRLWKLLFAVWATAYITLYVVMAVLFQWRHFR